MISHGTFNAKHHGMSQGHNEPQEMELQWPGFAASKEVPWGSRTIRARVKRVPCGGQGGLTGYGRATSHVTGFYK